MNVDEMVKGVHDVLAAKRVYGDPIERNGVVLVPAAVVRGGGGGGSDAESNGGGGFGVQSRAVGVYVIEEGRVRFEPAIDVNRVVGLGVLAFIVAVWSWRSVAKARARAAAR